MYEAKENQTKSVEINTSANTKRKTTKRETIEITPQIQKKSTETTKATELTGLSKKHEYMKRSDVTYAARC